MTREQTKEFIGNSKPALDHLYNAIGAYYKILDEAQDTLEMIKESKRFLSDLFMYRDQWSPNANYHYIQYMDRLKDLKTNEDNTSLDSDNKIKDALASIGATVDSMSNLAGSVLQISKQVLSLRFNSKPNISNCKKIGSQSIVEVIWEGRNHAMHWDQGTPRKKVQKMIDLLSKDLNSNIEIGKNNSLSILGALQWKSSEEVISDLEKLIS